ncbi:hypothetical protein BpHYR1_005519 [Brachionus plicatilis]|uniref:Uncharacterized protein n=1 Tax=Brachionus plicatilis TaxID=10195 RepID=A0A3M7SE26_BRAPC|nr:hypothetical protein BpHYR1_005519 [Brachionus plicatilis]
MSQMNKSQKNIISAAQKFTKEHCHFHVGISKKIPRQVPSLIKSGKELRKHNLETDRQMNNRYLDRITRINMPKILQIKITEIIFK